MAYAAGHRRHLTWVRTPLHDRDYQLAVVASNPEIKPKEIKRNLSKWSLVSSISTTALHHLSQQFKPKPSALDLKHAFVPNVRRVSLSWKRNRETWQMVNFVVGGQLFKTPEWIFQGHAHTLLGNLEQRNEFYCKRQGSYVFPETLPDVFAAVLEYYETGVLTRPERLTLNYFLEHVELFELESEAVDALLAREGVHKLAPDTPEWTGKRTCLSRTWEFLDNPMSSKLARIYSYVSFFLTVLAVVVYIVETLPELKAYSLFGTTSVTAIFQSPLTIINTICFLFFVFEFILRFICCPSKKRFLRTWTNWMEFLSIIPFLISMIVLVVYSESRQALPVRILQALRGCRLLMITRVLGTVRYYRLHWLTILTYTLWNNIKTLFILFFLMMICMVLFGGLIYAVEGVGEQNPTFATIPLGMWWAVITMTTVGYGDIVPQRAAGKIIGIVSGCVGLMFIGFVLESVTYEYRRLMRSNEQYLCYIADISQRQTKRRPRSVRPSHAESRKVSFHFGNDEETQGSHCSEEDLTDPRKVTFHFGNQKPMDSFIDEDEIHISINGANFFFSLAELQRHPNSLLGHSGKRGTYYNPLSGVYFLPRNMDIFPSIQQYYRTPDIPPKRPPFISMQRFVEELEFFQFEPQVVIDVFVSEGIQVMEEVLPASPNACYWHLVFEHYQYNFFSRVIMAINLLTTACFVLTIVLESLPSLFDHSCANNVTVANVSKATQVAVLTFSSYAYSNFFTGLCEGDLAFFLIETTCTAWFLTEFVARLSVAPSKAAFFRKPTTWIDILVILPYVFTVAQLILVAYPSPDVPRLFGFFRTLRLLSLVSILKVSKYFKEIEMIFAIFRSTWTELLMLCYFMLIHSIVFGTVEYVFEYDPDGYFNSIPQGMYWAWTTMLTIGYGDIYPKTTMGKVFGTGCAILGIVFWTLPMTLVSDHVANYRNMYEGQDYVMKCLTRMYHMRNSKFKINNAGYGSDFLCRAVDPLNCSGQKRRSSLPGALHGQVVIHSPRRASCLSNRSHLEEKAFKNGSHVTVVRDPIDAV